MPVEMILRIGYKTVECVVTQLCLVPQAHKFPALRDIWTSCNFNLLINKLSGCLSNCGSGASFNQYANSYQCQENPVPVHSVLLCSVSGVLAQRSERSDLPGNTYINAEYIKFLESAGARVVPILYV